MVNIALETAEDKCTFPMCSRKAGEYGFCPAHAKYYDGPKKKKAPIAIAKKSQKRARLDRKEYAPKAKQFIIDNPVCDIQIPGFCQFKSQCVNHRKGKASTELLLDEKYWQASCIPCNNEIERRDKWAKENGHKVSKFAVTV